MSIAGLGRGAEPRSLEAAARLLARTSASRPGCVPFFATLRPPPRCWHSRSTMAVHAAQQDCLRQPTFGDRSHHEATIAVLGDLHLEPDQMLLFQKARQQINSALANETTGEPLPCTGVVQLGDVGGYNHQPGSRNCFRTARHYLDGLKSPYAVITGNHDLEGQEFESDEHNLAVWQEMFNQRHFWAAEAGPLLCIGLSTVRFRSNNFSAHEVYIDDEQLAWFEQQLEEAGNSPVAVFTHAPAMGCGLKAVLDVHVKNRCAWLNQSSSNAREFVRLVHRFPNIKLWFSGHYHLSHDYEDSIAFVGGCAFVNTGVIGNCNRDGCRHSRILEATAEGYELFTLDHNEGTLRRDLRRSWDDTASNLSTRDSSSRSSSEEAAAEIQRRLSGQSASPPSSNGTGGESPSSAALQWFDIGGGRLLARHPKLLCEWDVELRSPVGAVFINMGEDDSLSFQDAAGNELHPQATTSGSLLDCQAAAAIKLHSPIPANDRQVSRNDEGSFFTIFQHNKWRLRKEKERAAAASRSPRPVH